MMRAGLRRRIVLAIGATSILTSLLFGLTTFMLAYSLEDRLFESELASEIRRQRAGWQATRQLLAPVQPYIRLYRAGSPLPVDLARQLGREPARREFAGDQGRHYHVARFRLPGSDGAPVIAVAETSKYLLVRPERNMLILFLVRLGAGVALFAALIGWWMATRALSPLTRLADGLAAGNGQVPQVDAGSYPRNEIGMLATALADAFERVREFVAREQEFTRDASHELRTPLAVIRNAAEVIGITPDLPPGTRPALRRIEAACIDLAQTLDLLLTLAREGNRRAHEPVLLAPLVDKAIDSAAVRFGVDLVGVSIDVPKSACVAVDPILLQLVLNNLIGNAFQHARGSKLAISGDTAALMIADTGPGLTSVPDPFRAFDKRPDSTGSGLGLAIVRRLCEAAGIALSWQASEMSPGAYFMLDFSRLPTRSARHYTPYRRSRSI